MSEWIKGKRGSIQILKGCEMEDMMTIFVMMSWPVDGLQTDLSAPRVQRIKRPI